MRMDTHGRRHRVFEITLVVITRIKLNDNTRAHICYTGISSMIKHYILKSSSLKFRDVPRGGETFHPAGKLPKNSGLKSFRKSLKLARSNRPLLLKLI